MQSKAKEEAAIERVEPKLTFPADELAVQFADKLGPAIAQGVAQGIAQAVGASVIPTPARIIELEDRLRQAEEELRNLAQHGLNVLVAFQIRATGTRVNIVGGFEATDLETATSVAMLGEYARAAGCEGLDLLPGNAEESAGIFGQVPANSLLFGISPNSDTSTGRDLVRRGA